MAVLVWDQTGEREYSTGCDRGVVYPQDSKGAYPSGSAWNGITGVDESPSGADSNKIYADNLQYLNLRGAEEFGGTIKSYMYPDAFFPCLGIYEYIPGVRIHQQTHQPFGFSWRTLNGNDTEGQDHGETIHIVWNATTSPSDASWETVNDNPDANEFSFEFDTTSVELSTKKDDGTAIKPMSYIEFNKNDMEDAQWTALTGALWGTSEKEAYLPSPDELLALLKAATAA